MPGPTGPTGGGVICNANATDVVANATDTYLTGSALGIATALKVGTVLRWRLYASKSSAGTATPQWNIRWGAGGTVTDTSRTAFNGLAQTAATDNGYIEIVGVVRATGASTVVQHTYKMVHRLATTGMQSGNVSVQQAISTGFDSTGAGFKVGISVNPGTSGVWTFQIIDAQAEGTTV